MCGIAGTAGAPRPDPGAARERWPRRWPSAGRTGRASGTTTTAGLAFRRLAIIDLHERSSQPMHLGNAPSRLQRRDLQLPELRDALRGLGHRFRDRGRRGGSAPRLGGVGGAGSRAPERNVRLRGLGREGPTPDALQPTRSARSPSTTRARPAGGSTFASDIKAIALDPAVIARRGPGSARRVRRPQRDAGSRGELLRRHRAAPGRAPPALAGRLGDGGALLAAAARGCRADLRRGGGAAARAAPRQRPAAPA